ncbi:hypothetical protein THAOC_31127 [Thalassiosira oceanica]|uniref:Uncharacterized protein n=1 Tax=Thalassiosira oceanica TaxID=159749 RepID=K0RCD5_THAOC|nr:hypothetical protein THAOC_31127 [Thalassiosira oceanica]|eukprot:EJK49949.1 hypothetical protein THAOC_31127 [Thalassiosira oceanica]
MNDVSRHLSALSAFDECGVDDAFSALQTKVNEKLAEQRTKTKVAEKERSLLQERLREAKAISSVTSQIVNASRNALKIAPNEDAATLQTVIDRLRQSTLHPCRGNSSPSYIADTATTQNLNSEIASLSLEIESLMTKFKGLSDEREGCTLPTKVVQAVTSLRVLLADNNGCARFSEKDVDSLEDDLSAKIIDGTSRKDVEKIGLKRIALLRSTLSKEIESVDAKRLNEHKSKELQLRMKQDELTRVSKSANKENEDHERELEKAKRRYESSKLILNHDDGQPTEGDIEKDVTLNIEKFKEHLARKNRTSYRQLEREMKSTLQSERAEEAAREEEARLFRLQALASSCPYTKTLQGLTADIHKTTESRKQDVYSGRNDLLDCQANRQTNFGTDRLFSDSKFRLGNALHEAGIANTSAARDAVRMAIPRTEARTTGIRPF